MILNEMEIKDDRKIEQFGIKDWLKTVYEITDEELLTLYYKKLVSGQIIKMYDKSIDADQFLWCEERDK